MPEKTPREPVNPSMFDGKLTEAQLAKISVNLEMAVVSMKGAKAELEDIDHTNINAIREYWGEMIDALGLEVEMIKQLLEFY